MGICGIRIKENPFYASYEDDCWVILAKVIMSECANSYANKIPITARSQEEYNELDKKSYAPVRRSILKNLKNGPLRSSLNIASVYSALEHKRLENKASLGIRWKENSYIDIDKL